MPHLLILGLSIYFVFALGTLDHYFNRTTLQIFIFLLPLTLLVIFKSTFWIYGMVGVPFAAMAIACRDVYAHRELNDSYWPRRKSRGYKLILIIVACAFFGLNLFVFFSNKSFTMPQHIDFKHYFAFPVSLFMFLYMIFLSAHKVFTYLIVPILPYKTEVRQVRIVDFFKLVVSKSRGISEIHYCVVFDPDASCWHLRGSQFKQYVIKQWSIYEYTVCTGFMDNKFIKGVPIILSETKTVEQQSNLSTYYPGKQYLVLEVAAIILGSLMLSIFALIYLFIISLQMFKMPEVVIFPVLQIVVAAGLFILGIFFAVKGFKKIPRAAKLTHSPISYIGSNQFADRIAKTLNR